MYKLNFKNIIIGCVAIFVLYNTHNIMKMFGIMEPFHTYVNDDRIAKSNYWWDPKNQLPTPYMNIANPYDYRYSNETMEQIAPQGDLILTNLYRKLHNLEAMSWNEVMGHSHVKNAGGGEAGDRQFYIAEAIDRERMRIQRQIKDIIASRRIPYTDAFDESPIGGNFYECHMGNCQWDLDIEGKILGIPSVPGIRHTYH